jgi:hypothetical protein
MMKLTLSHRCSPTSHVIQQSTREMGWGHMMNIEYSNAMRGHVTNLQFIIQCQINERSVRGGEKHETSPGKP